MEAEASSPTTSPPSVPTVRTVPTVMATETGQVAEVEAELAAVEQALTRLDEGTYATCEVCGSTLGDDVLETSPTTRRCPNHP